MDLSISLIPLTLFTICLCSMVTFYLNYKIQTSENFGKVLLFIIFFIFVNSFNALIVEVFFRDQQWRISLAPFILLYGPLLYFGIIALRDDQLPTSKIWLHSIPFLGYLLFFLALSTGAIKFTETLAENVNKQLYALGPISFIVYTVLSFLGGKKLFALKHRDCLLLFVFGRVALLFLAALFFIVYFSKSMSSHPEAKLLLRMIAYACMLIFILLVFNFSVNKLLNRFSRSGGADQNQAKTETDAKYEKSPLSNNQLKSYQKKLNDLMQKEKVYLDTNLSLTSLAYMLKIPNHHLTQVFSTQFNQTFYQYVNGFRIDYACDLLRENSGMNLEELAEKSGFNSKPSFNRQFKSLKGRTPSEYRLQESMQH